MRAGRLAYQSIKLGFPGAAPGYPPGVGGAGGAAAPCRRPRRAPAPRRPAAVIGRRRSNAPGEQGCCDVRCWTATSHTARGPHMPALDLVTQIAETIYRIQPQQIE